VTRRILAAIVLAFAALAFPAPQGEKTPKPKSAYEALLEMVKDGDTKIDFQTLRYTYLDSADAKKDVDLYALRRRMIEALNAKQYDEALRNAEKILDACFVNAQAHMVASIAYDELGHAERAKYHREIARGLVRSVLSSGDGKSAKTAWVVISIAEEHAVMSALGLQPESQSLQGEGGHNFDVWKVKDPATKSAGTVYFNIDKFFGRYD
jgi:hypothetical protein